MMPKCAAEPAGRDEGKKVSSMEALDHCLGGETVQVNVDLLTETISAYDDEDDD